MELGRIQELFCRGGIDFSFTNWGKTNWETKEYVHPGQRIRLCTRYLKFIKDSLNVKVKLQKKSEMM